MKTTRLKPLFVETIPEIIEEGILYVSMNFATAMHRCACGCGEEVVTPLSPTDWQLRFDGENVSLEPSIGNWSFRCQSHYWLRAGMIRWSSAMSGAEIQGGRTQDSRRKSHFYKNRLFTPQIAPTITADSEAKAASRTSRLQKLKQLLGWKSGE